MTKQHAGTGPAEAFALILETVLIGELEDAWTSFTPEARAGAARAYVPDDEADVLAKAMRSEHWDRLRNPMLSDWWKTWGHDATAWEVKEVSGDSDDVVVYATRVRTVAASVADATGFDPCPYEIVPIEMRRSDDGWQYAGFHRGGLVSAGDAADESADEPAPEPASEQASVVQGFPVEIPALREPSLSAHGFLAELTPRTPPAPREEFFYDAPAATAEVTEPFLMTTAERADGQPARRVVIAFEMPVLTTAGEVLYVVRRDLAADVPPVGPPLIVEPTITISGVYSVPLSFELATRFESRLPWSTSSARTDAASSVASRASLPRRRPPASRSRPASVLSSSRQRRTSPRSEQRGNSVARTDRTPKKGAGGGRTARTPKRAAGRGVLRASKPHGIDLRTGG